MEKYIKLDDVKELVNQLSSAGFTIMSSRRAEIVSSECILKLLDKLPAKELDDFTEGEWEWKGLDGLYNPYMSHCSECGHLGDEVWSYCPHCGSKMKKMDKEIKYITQQGVTGTIIINDTELKNFVISDYKE